MEIHELDEFLAHARRSHSLRGWFVQSVDLRGVSAELERLDVHNAVFLGCRFAEGTEASLTTRGALIFPELPGLPFSSYRARLYTADELFTDATGRRVTYADTYDGRVYGWYRDQGDHPDIAADLAMTLHDHAIGDALAELPHAHEDLVGMMGGHALRRDAEGYRAAARLARQVTRAGRVVVTGGGPGAMEAANLGASLADHPDPVLDEALDLLASVPDFRPSIDAWAHVALEVCDRWPAGDRGRSIGIPTWFYGHEPPNVFATSIAKYFNNALREATLLHRCRGGIVVLPGAAGTTQEVFQASTWNYYASNEAEMMPLILVDPDHWRDTLPAWQLLSALARGRAMERHIHLVHDVDEAAPLLMPTR